MESATPDPSLQVLFGKAFLVEINRGDIEKAKVFARAFLLQTPLESQGPIATVPAAS